MRRARALAAGAALALLGAACRESPPSGPWLQAGGLSVVVDSVVRPLRLGPAAVAHFTMRNESTRAILMWDCPPPALQYAAGSGWEDASTYACLAVVYPPRRLSAGEARRDSTVIPSAQYRYRVRATYWFESEAPRPRHAASAPFEVP